MKKLFALTVGLGFLAAWTELIHFATGLGAKQAPKEESPSEAYVPPREDWRRFVLTNHGTEPIWFEGYSERYPLTIVQRLSRDGWVAARADWCGTGADPRRLEGGASMTFQCSVTTDRSDSSPYASDLLKSPELQDAPYRIGVFIARDADFRTAEKLWSEPMRSPDSMISLTPVVGELAF